MISQVTKRRLILSDSMTMLTQHNQSILDISFVMKWIAKNNIKSIRPNRSTFIFPILEEIPEIEGQRVIIFENRTVFTKSE